MNRYHLEGRIMDSHGVLIANVVIEKESELSKHDFKRNYIMETSKSLNVPISRIFIDDIKVLKIPSMFEGYRKTTFIDALKRWDTLDKKAICVYRQSVYHYDIVTEWKEHFQPLNGALVLDGEWFTEI